VSTPDRNAAIPALGVAIAILAGVVVAWLTDDWWLAFVIVGAVALTQFARFRRRRLDHEGQSRSD
jgi:hypothetical protein